MADAEVATTAVATAAAGAAAIDNKDEGNIVKKKDQKGYTCSIKLGANHHGKGRVKVTKVIRGPNGNDSVKEFTVEILLYGGCDKAYTHGCNDNVIATDTQKNTVYVLARKETFNTAEEFAMIVAKHFVNTHAHIITRCQVSIDEKQWVRIVTADSHGNIAPHKHAFRHQGPRTGYASAVAAQGSKGAVITSLSSGLRKMTLLKTTQSSFSGFQRDKYTLLPEVSNRLMSTSVDATWEWDLSYALTHGDFESMNAALTNTLAETFHGPSDTGVPSQSVQETAYFMGHAALEKVQEVKNITLYLPNIHNLPVDFSRFGLVNKDHAGLPDTFIATTEPHGIIQCTVERVSAPDSDSKGPAAAKAPVSGGSQITTHVLDTSSGRPAAGIAIALQQCDPQAGFSVVSSGITDSDGRVSNLLSPGKTLAPGKYKMVFSTGAYYHAKGQRTFYPEVSIQFETFDREHYHVPLLLNPFGFSTYRGS